MLGDYRDILALTPEDPKWWDDYGVPRYCDFEPSMARPYADECCLLLIACQACRREFQVSISLSRMDRLSLADPSTLKPTLAELVEASKIGYGDPPFVGCCGVGYAMNSVPVRVLQFWRRPRAGGGWERVPELEKDVPPDWIDDSFGATKS